MENPIPITMLNDFIFCPVSIYFHNLDAETDNLTMQDEYQLNGSASHESVDEGSYSDRKNIFQGMTVYSEKYNLLGKIDIFDADKGILTERKRKIKTIYDGYIFQLYAQYYALKEMGYNITHLRLYSMDDNKMYNIETPGDNIEMNAKFEQTIDKINHFSFEAFVQENALKCEKCIYSPMCSFSNIKE